MVIPPGKLGIASARLTAKQQTERPDASQQRDRTFDLRSAPSEGAGTPPSRLKTQAKSPALAMQLSEERLRKSLPMKPGALVKLPILLHSPEVGSLAVLLCCRLCCRAWGQHGLAGFVGYRL